MKKRIRTRKRGKELCALVTTSIYTPASPWICMLCSTLLTSSIWVVSSMFLELWIILGTSIITSSVFYNWHFKEKIGEILQWTSLFPRLTDPLLLASLLILLSCWDRISVYRPCWRWMQSDPLASQVLGSTTLLLSLGSIARHLGILCFLCIWSFTVGVISNSP